MATVTVIGDRKTVVGFRLAGAVTKEAPTLDDARRLLFEAVASGAAGIVLYDEALLAALTDKERRILDACHRPICFPVPMAERRRAGEREAEYLASVLRAAIGYQLRIPR
jgi:vacuolar-type H+-ATPase subunit F/Vma7